MKLKNQMLSLAKSAGFELTENFENIVKEKERLGVGLRCPRDINNPDCYCISYHCALDTIKDGRCRCNCFRLPK